MQENEVIVVRYGHRIVRDYRVTTHCCLVARALGAKEIIVLGEEDKSLLETIKEVNKKWGSKFRVSFAKQWKNVFMKLKKKGYNFVNLTMYGLPVQKEIKRIRKNQKIAVLIGSQKVPIEVYNESNYNIAVSNQPHSEIAALSIFLHELFQGKELGKKYAKAKLKIIPIEKGKKIKSK
ncbi:MAG: tRNA (cytidine(56)-2'-O)-methyltransferase [archaeon]